MRGKARRGREPKTSDRFLDVKINKLIFISAYKKPFTIRKNCKRLYVGSVKEITF